MADAIKSTGQRLVDLTLAALALNPLGRTADEEFYSSKPIAIVVLSVVGNVTDVAIRLIERSWSALGASRC